MQDLWTTLVHCLAFLPQPRKMEKINHSMHLVASPTMMQSSIFLVMLVQLWNQILSLPHQSSTKCCHIFTLHQCSLLSRSIRVSDYFHFQPDTPNTPECHPHYAIHMMTSINSESIINNTVGSIDHIAITSDTWNTSRGLLPAHLLPETYRCAWIFHSILSYLQYDTLVSWLHCSTCFITLVYKPHVALY